MKYLSEDGVTFETEQECLEYEGSIRKRVEEERIRRERLEIIRKEKLNAIGKKYNELQELVLEYRKSFSCSTNRNGVRFAPLYEFINLINN